PKPPPVDPFEAGAEGIRSGEALRSAKLTDSRPVARRPWSVTVTGLRVVATHHQAFVKPHIMTVGGIV
ncbi:MAG: hypothetical protein V2A73_15685, partial [Pseudomonadota bacterium]